MHLGSVINGLILPPVVIPGNKGTDYIIGNGPAKTSTTQVREGFYQKRKEKKNKGVQLILVMLIEGCSVIVC